MNNIEQNALRIAELIGNNNEDGCNAYERVIECCGYAEWLFKENEATTKTFSSYNGLMDIVLESYQSDSTYIRILQKTTYVVHNEIFIEGYNYAVLDETKPTKEGFIEAIQLACIKYLELKNEH